MLLFTSLGSLRCLRRLLSNMVGDHASSLSLRTKFSFPFLMGVEVAKVPPSASEVLCVMSLSELGLTLILAATRPLLLLVAATMALDLGTGTAGVGERVLSGDDMEWVWSGRLRKMEGENVSSLLLEDFSVESGERNPELR